MPASSRHAFARGLAASLAFVTAAAAPPGAAPSGAAVATGAPPAGASAEALATPEQGLALGRAVGRALVSFQSPDMCAIPVLAGRCRADFDAFVGGDDAAFDRVPGLGPAPLAHMRAYFATGDPAQYPKGFATIRTATAPDGLWARRPAVAWAMDEGIVDETVASELHTQGAVYATPPAAQMLRRVREGGADAALVGGDATTADGHFPAAALDRLVAAIDARHPAPPLPALPDVSGDRGDVVLGMGFATVFQMCDAPGVAALPESQAFFDRFFASAARFSTVPDAARRLAADRAALRFTRGYDAANAAATIADLVKYQNALPGATLRRTLIGQFASQIGYDATVQRDPQFFAYVSRNVTKWSDADAAFPGLAKRRVDLGLIDPRDFPAQRRASMALIGFLLLDADRK